MPIKQIQLRGISRTPSDRSTADGGCAESLNVHLNNQETVPTLAPIPVDVYGNLSEMNRFPIVYIHKMPGGATFYIGLQTDIWPQHHTYYGLVAYDGNGEMLTMGTYVFGEEAMTYITSIGNTVIAFTGTTPHYFLYKGGEYTYMGTQIPIPRLEVVTFKTSEVHLVDNRLYELGGRLTHDQMVGFMGDSPGISAINTAIEIGGENHDDFVATWRNLWDEVSKGIAKKRHDGYFVAPFFLRLAVKLYDGTYIHVSDPIFCGGGNSRYSPYLGLDIDDTVWLAAAYSHIVNTQVIGDYITYGFLNSFVLKLYMDSYPVGNWKDIVKSIDVFISEPIYTPTIEDEALRLNSGEGDDFFFVFKGMSDEEKDEYIKEQVIGKTNFYKIKSYEIDSEDDMAKLASREAEIRNSDDLAVDLLVTHERLSDGYRTSNQYVPIEGAMTFNNRVMNIGVNEIVSRGLPFMNGLMADISILGRPDLSFVLKYKIVNASSGEVCEFRGYERTENSSFTPAVFVTRYSGPFYQYYGTEEIIDPPTPTSYWGAIPYSWISYPDTRCTQVEVHVYRDGVWAGGKVIPMEPHPGLECAYAFLGYGVKLEDVLLDSHYDDAVKPGSSDVENLIMNEGNKIFLSEFENPFIYPASNIITFPDKVIGAAMTSAPLSEGQVGDFDLYVFTEGGIRVLKTNSVGSFSGNNVMPTNLSRHIALPGTITPLEQAVVFITERGVMLLSGGQVVELSTYMNGMPFALPQAIKTLLESSPWSDLLGAMSEEDPLMAFMRTAKAAYDNNGARLIFFNPEEPYQFTYHFETQTWHKILTGITHATILNSYPDCLISYKQGLNETPALANFSTTLDDADVLSDILHPVKGIIVTRPFDLDEPDVRKSINDLRIRGQFNRGDVKYILMGSMDGHSWQRLTSLRGGSYKFFQMILLCSLTPLERVSWIDIEYETRFANKLR